jgi:hypothetical protein
MRTLFGVVLGIVLTVGAAYFHDQNVRPDPLNPSVADEQIVNWPVFTAVVHEITDGIGGLWDRITGK